VGSRPEARKCNFAGCRPELRDRCRAVDGPFIDKFDDQVNTLT
jgi:hypothetical protein